MAHVSFYIQRISGGLLAGCLLIHIATILYAVQGGLSVAEIQNRIQGSEFWFVLYSIFIFAAIVHAAIGLKNVFSEWIKLPPVLISVLVLVYFVVSSFLGISAILAIW